AVVGWRHRDATRVRESFMESQISLFQALVIACLCALIGFVAPLMTRAAANIIAARTKRARRCRRVHAVWALDEDFDPQPGDVVWLVPEGRSYKFLNGYWEPCLLA